MPDNEIERLTLIHEWPEVCGLRVVVTETAEHPRTVTVAVMGTADRWLNVSQVRQ
ncbi:hypothetical protein [Methylobacterium iners]|uniref:Transposase n=1 Tax=Methylobacterium iners TaxID=418707 RepID=A0ABQ4RUK7_9HYPH|nr:hypothetical protein [Methylobacterium iners]GJD94521.1 hypothetical protein OCOJLMKI_1724 [Methylobacterium iners]